MRRIWRKAATPVAWASRMAAALCAWLAAGGAAAGEVRVAAATNFRSTLDEISADFEERSSHRILVAAGSTGKLYAQIMNGAPFDVFLAADQERPARLVAEGAALKGSRFTYAIGRLVLWGPGETSVGPERLRAGDFRRLALANPDLAPYGAAAREVIFALDAEEATRGKVVLGENIGQAYAFVRSGAADVGLVAMSQLARTPPAEQGGFWTPPEDLYKEIRQDAVLLTRGGDNEAARAFLDYLNGEDAGRIIESGGYARE